MERLTFDGNFCDIAQCAEVRGSSFCDDGACSQHKTWERLKEYEDTGLMPREVDTLKEENARLHNENFWLCGRVDNSMEVVRYKDFKHIPRRWDGMQ